MSAIEIMRSIGRPIAYHPALARHVGGVNAAIFLCQLIYWDEKADNEELGVYKTADEWESETGLSYREQAGARKKLRDLGLLTETNQRLHHRIYYKLERAAFDALMESVFDGNGEIREPTKAQFPNDENAIGEQPEAQSGNSAKRSSSNDENATRYIDIDYTETTTEITTENISGDSSDDLQFERAWSLYPKRAGGNSKAAARKAWNARLKAGVSADDMIDGVERYAAFCHATGRTGTQFVRQAATFFGPDLHFEERFDIPANAAKPQTNAERIADWDARMNEVLERSLQPVRQPMKDMGKADAII